VIAPWAAEYVGIPWRDGGRTREGCDCFGMLRLVLHDQFGVEIPSYTGTYVSAREREEVARLLTTEIPKGGWLIADGAVRPGDGVVFRLRNVPWHVGVIVGPDDFLHVEETIGSACVERLSAARWARRLVGVYRHEALA
jgi:cell wall-associated NlpC family hydrolase